MPDLAAFGWKEVGTALGGVAALIGAITGIVKQCSDPNPNGPNGTLTSTVALTSQTLGGGAKDATPAKLRGDATEVGLTKSVPGVLSALPANDIPSEPLPQKRPGVLDCAHHNKNPMCATRAKVNRYALLSSGFPTKEGACAQAALQSKDIGHTVGVFQTQGIYATAIGPCPVAEIDRILATEVVGIPSVKSPLKAPGGSFREVCCD